jgi:Mce-associated membrane protein
VRARGTAGRPAAEPIRGTAAPSGTAPARGTPPDPDGPDPDGPDPDGPDPHGPGPGDAELPARRRWWRGPLALAVASVVLALAGAGLLIGAAQVRSSPAAANRALTDQAATRQVLAQVTAGVSAIYSYSSADIGAAERAAQRVLAGQAAAQYRELFPLLQRDAAGQQLTVVSRVIRAGVSFLSSDTAHVLVFINQTATRGHNKGSNVPAQLAITAQLRGSRWLITAIEAR